MRTTTVNFRQMTLVTVLGVLCGSAVLNAAEVQELRCEYRTNPIGVDILAPRLSWIIFDAPLPRPDHKDGSGNDCRAWRREIVYDGGPYRRGLLRGHTYRKSSRARSDTSSSAILDRIGILQPV
jgi:hypothetical protein